MLDTNRGKIQKFISSHTELSMPKEQMSMLLECFEAMGNFYQLIPLKKVYEILTVDYNEEISEKEFYELTDALHNDPIGFYYIDSHDEVYNHLNTSPSQDRQIVHESIIKVDIDIYEKIRELKKNKPYYVPEKEELLKYFDDMYYEETEPLKNMRRFFIRRFPQNHNTALDIVDDIALCIGNEDYSIDDSLDTVQRFGYNMSLDETKEFVPYFEELRNNFRMPANNGYTPVETEAIFKEQGINGNSLLVKDIKIDDAHEAERRNAGLEKSASLDILSYAFKMKLEENGIKLPALKNLATVKIGRNDPCPCGSGKKFKKCCGR